jgi:uncharacterized protein with von Willebrand factor type A (vWA) domain
MSEPEPFLENVLLFPRMLRRAGMPVSPEQSMDFARALELVGIGDRDQVFHASRSLLVTRHAHLRLFETLFNLFWRPPNQAGPVHPQTMPVAPRHRRQQQNLGIMTLMAQKARQSDPELDVADRAGTFSPSELLQQKAFSSMTVEELEAVKRLIRTMRWDANWRITRRRVADRHGDALHLRRVLRSAAKHGGVPVQLHWQSRKIKQRPLVLLADISGSMERYARLLLQLFYSVSYSFKQVECFVFGTRLTRITSQLKLKNIDRAVDQAARHVIDWSGGTRIGESLAAFNVQWSRRVLRRGAVVLIVSDGWERGDVSVLKRQMRYLHHRCHRLIWLNPLLGRPDYRPMVEGMTAALPYIDDFLPAHNLQSLADLAGHLGPGGRPRWRRLAGRRRHPKG